MKKFRRILLGVLLVLAGVIFALNSLEITNINIFFKGWWTLFIIIPCFVNIFTDRDKVGNIFAMAIGIILLLCCQGILDFSVFWKLILPIVIITVGLSMIFSGLFIKRKLKSHFKKLGCDEKNFRINYTVFSGTDINCAGEVFEGADLKTIFGGIDMDLRGAIIEKDCEIFASVAFGGIDIIVPDDVNVKINSSVYFGGVSNNCENRAVDNAPTLYINCTGAFGGIEIMNREDD